MTLKLAGSSSLATFLIAGQNFFTPPSNITTTLEFPSLIKMLYLVGLGLSDETDITVKGLAVVKNASRVYLEAYTSILLVDKQILVSLCHARN